jgi:hypothetical protein
MLAQLTTPDGLDPAPRSRPWASSVRSSTDATHAWLQRVYSEPIGRPPVRSCSRPASAHRAGRWERYGCSSANGQGATTSARLQRAAASLMIRMRPGFGLISWSGAPLRHTNVILTRRRPIRSGKPHKCPQARLPGMPGLPPRRTVAPCPLRPPAAGWGACCHELSPGRPAVRGLLFVDRDRNELQPGPMTVRARRALARDQPGTRLALWPFANSAK